MNRRTRLALVVAITLGGVFLVYTVARKPVFGINYRVYRVAAEAALAGESFYGVVPAGLPEQYVYRYPPATVLVFLPLALVPPVVGYAALTAVNVAAGVAVAVLATRWARRRGVVVDGVDYGLLVVAAVASSLAVPSLVYGNVNHVVAALVAWAVVTVDPAGDGGPRREALAGVALVLAATVKLFPALFGVYFLLRRAWRAVGAAVATGVGILVVGVAAFGIDAHRAWVRTAIVERATGDGGVMDPGVTYVTLQRPLSHLLASPWLAVASIGLAGIVVAAVVARERYGSVGDAIRAVAGGGPGREAAEEPEGTAVALAVLLAGVVAVPSFPLYLTAAYVPALVAPAVWSGRRGQLAAVGLAFVHVAVQLDDVVAMLGTVPGPIATGLTWATPPLLGVGCCWWACLWRGD